MSYSLIFKLLPIIQFLVVSSDKPRTLKQNVYYEPMMWFTLWQVRGYSALWSLSFFPHYSNKFSSISIVKHNKKLSLSLSLYESFTCFEAICRSEGSHLPFPRRIIVILPSTYRQYCDDTDPAFFIFRIIIII